MKFGEKYELLESITTGRVETFVANDKVRGSRVLVHILECEAQKPNQPTVQWVLEAFRRVAPEPAALVLETGRYSGTLYAYLVTKLPEEAALNNWLRLYKAQSGDTQETPIPAKSSAESEAPTANVSSKEPSPPSAASLTQLFREFDSSVQPAASSVSPPTAASALPPTPQVKPSPDHSAIHPAPDWNADAKTPPASPAKAGPTIAASQSSFSSAFTPPNLPVERNSPVKDGPKPGEFTSFFQGPFRVEGPPEIPTVSPQPIEPPRKSVGDFTAMFNPPRADEPGIAAGSAVAGSAGNESPGTGFTGWFSNPNLAPRPSGTSATPPSGLHRPPVEDFAAYPPPLGEPLVPAPLVSPRPAANVATPPIFPIPPLPAPVLEKPAVKLPSVPAPEGATSAFQRPINSPASVEPKPVGPSAYTQIISVKPSAGPIGAAKAASPASLAAPMPSLPSIASPPMPAAPPAPKITAPPAPKAPKVATAEAPPVSYWPLILTLTVLFFLAVLLVLYFVLKH